MWLDVSCQGPLVFEQVRFENKDGKMVAHNPDTLEVNDT